MKITQIKTLWPEPSDFQLERKDTGEDYIFIHLLTAAVLSSNAGTAVCPAGSCICYQPHAYQFLAAAEPEGLVHNWAHIRGDFSAMADRYGFLCNHVYFLRDDTAITDIFHIAELETLHQKPHADDICTMKMAELLIHILRQTDDSGQDTKITPALYEMMAGVRAAIHMEYSRPWQVPDMAALAHLSPSRFYSLYKLIFGISPKSDLQAIRLEHAKVLLAENRRSVKEIAEAVGYANEYYFIHAFKRATGHTPGKYRRLP